MIKLLRRLGAKVVLCPATNVQRAVTPTDWAREKQLPAEIIAALEEPLEAGDHELNRIDGTNPNQTDP